MSSFSRPPKTSSSSQTRSTSSGLPGTPTSRPTRIQGPLLPVNHTAPLPVRQSSLLPVFKVPLFLVNQRPLQCRVLASVSGSCNQNPIPKVPSSGEPPQRYTSTSDWEKVRSFKTSRLEPDPDRHKSQRVKEHMCNRENTETRHWYDAGNNISESVR